MPTISFFKRFALLLALPAMLLFSACDSNDDHDDDHFGQLERVEVRDRASGELYASYTRSGGDSFDGDVHLHPGDEVALNVLFFDEDGNQASLSESGEFSLGIRLAEVGRDGVDSVPDIVAFEAHGDHADIEALAEGETYLVFQLMHGGHSDGDSPALRFEVDDH